MVRFNYDTVAWRRVRLVVLDRDGWRCRIRGPRCRGDADRVDHIIPVEAGGALYDEANLRGACAPCNRARARPAETNGMRGAVKPSRDW